MLVAASLQKLNCGPSVEAEKFLQTAYWIEQMEKELGQADAILGEALAQRCGQESYESVQQELSLVAMEAKTHCNFSAFLPKLQDQLVLY